MNTLMLTTNIKKEIWEYKKIFLWLPVLIAALIVISPLLSYLLNDVSLSDSMYQFERLAEHQHREGFSKIAFGFISVLFVPFIAVASIVQLYYFIACLFDERRDMSILFWRSLPVSDAMSVGVKLLVGSLILPAIFMLAATATFIVFLVACVLLCIVLSLGYDISLWGLFLSADIISNIAITWANLLPYALWMFPVYAWLMLVSMYSSKAPFLWSILPVVIVLLIEGFIVRYFNLDGMFFADLLKDYFSFSREAIGAFANKHEFYRTAPLEVLFSKISIAGLFVGAGFMYATYWLRANRSHS